MISMDLFELPQTSKKTKPQFRFSWIAFDQENPVKRVLFDSHPRKGPHFHIDGETEGQPFTWSSVPKAIELFQQKIQEHFGELIEVPDEGGFEQ